jgi:hypothetical protein
VQIEVLSLLVGAARSAQAEEHPELGKVPLLPRSLRIELLDGGVALSRGLAQRRNQVFGAAGLWSWSLMTRRKQVSAIAIIVALPASADTVFDGIGATAAARDFMVDSGLI